MKLSLNKLLVVNLEKWNVNNMHSLHVHYITVSKRKPCCKVRQSQRWIRTFFNNISIICVLSVSVYVLVKSLAMLTDYGICTILLANECVFITCMA